MLGWRVATYRRSDGSRFHVAYDADGPCIACGLPVMHASMAGPVVCPWCDLGECRFDRAHTLHDGGEGPRGHYAREHAERLAATARGN